MITWNNLPRPHKAHSRQIRGITTPPTTIIIKHVQGSLLPAIIHARDGVWNTHQHRSTNNPLQNHTLWRQMAFQSNVYITITQRQGLLKILLNILYMYGITTSYQKIKWGNLSKIPPCLQKIHSNTKFANQLFLLKSNKH